MERDFRYLRDAHGDAGARDIFEKSCTRLLQAKFGEDAHNIRVSKGDDGIDVLVGDFSRPIEVYQCKYFLDGINGSQKSQIRESFKTAISSSNYKMKKWVLCIPCILSANEFKWWSEWKHEQIKMYDIEIALYDGSYLIEELKKYDLYNREFDEDERIALTTILKELNSEKERRTREIMTSLADINPNDYKDMIFVKKLENAHIDMIDECKRDYFTAEIVEQAIRSKEIPENTQLFEKLKKKVREYWVTQFRRYQSDVDGNDLLTRVYERIEDADTTTLSCASLPEVSLEAKKGILHQWAEECSVGWLRDYKEKLEIYLKEEEKNGD